MKQLTVKEEYVQHIEQQRHDLMREVVWYRGTIVVLCILAGIGWVL